MSSNEDHWEAAQEGAERLREGDPEGAVQVLEDLAAEQPDNEYAFFFLGNARFERKELSKALRAYLTALELEPGYLGALIGAGHTLRMLGQYTEAIRVSREVLRRASSDPDALYLLGLCHFSMGDNAAAQKYLEQFLETQPEIEIAMEVEGVLQILRGEHEPLDPSEQA